MLAAGHLGVSCFCFGMSLEQLKSEFTNLGGDQRVLKNLGSGIRAEALLKYHIRKLKENVSGISKPTASVKKSEPKYTPQTHFKDFISEYPVELHQAYLKRREAFLEACSLKVQLNNLPDESILQAGRLQWKIWHLFKEFDRLQKILRHYKETKRILPMETTENFSDIPTVQLHLKLRNLRSLKTNRKKTIKRLREALPDADDATFKARFSELNRKIEQLAELDLQIEKLQEMIGVL